LLLRVEGKQEMTAEKDTKCLKTLSDECFSLLEIISISNKVEVSENYEINGDISMVELISDNKKLSVMYKGRLNNEKANFTFMSP
jgi:hypothetical protein